MSGSTGITLTLATLSASNVMKSKNTNIVESFILENYKVGDVLPCMDQLYFMLGCSRQYLREQMIILSCRGILEIKHGKATKVISDALNCEEHF